MMRVRTVLTVASVWLMAMGTAVAEDAKPTVKEIVKKYSKAIGLGKLVKGRTLQAVGTVTYDNRTKDVEPLKLIMKAPDKLRLEAAIDGTTIVMIANGKKVAVAMGRSDKKMGKLRDMSDQGAPTMKQFQMLADMTHMTHLGTYFKKVSLGKDQTVNNRDCHVIVGEDKVLGTCKFMICKKTLELVRYVGFFFNKNLTLVVDCKQWTTHDGVKFPKQVVVSLKKAHISCTVNFTGFKVGPTLDDKLFATDKPVVELPKLESKETSK